MICPNCKKEIADGSKFCPECGKAIQEEKVENINYFPKYSGEQEIYINAFSEFDLNGFKPTWSWVGFFWGAIWYCIKGMWAKGLLIIGLAIITGGTLGIPLWIYCGVFGKWDYYLWKSQKKQWW